LFIVVCLFLDIRYPFFLVFFLLAFHFMFFLLFRTGDYMDYALGIAYAMKKLTVGLTYHNTHDCDLTDGTCDGQLVASLSTS
jgi:hypothetical protein